MNQVGRFKKVKLEEMTLGEEEEVDEEIKIEGSKLGG